MPDDGVEEKSLRDESKELGEIELAGLITSFESDENDLLFVSTMDRAVGCDEHMEHVRA